MKRFTATEKWDDLWFRTLSPHLKLLWLYLCDKCDHAGIWNQDLDHASYLIGAGKFTEAEAIRAFGERVQVLPNGRWYIKKFVAFQYGQLKADNNCHKSVIRRLLEFGIEPLTNPRPTLGQPLRSPSEGAKDKEEDKEEEEGGSGGSAPSTTASMAKASRQLLEMFGRKPDERLVYSEESALLELVRLPDFPSQLEEHRRSKSADPRYFPKSISSLLSKWTETLDRYRNNGDTNDTFTPVITVAQMMANNNRRRE